MTTPNSDVLYAMSYVDLGKDGPLVMEAPPVLQGILLDYWQRPIPFADGTPSKPSGDLNTSWINTIGGFLALDSRINFFTNYYSISPIQRQYRSDRCRSTVRIPACAERGLRLKQRAYQ